MEFKIQINILLNVYREYLLKIKQFVSDSSKF